VPRSSRGENFRGENRWGQFRGALSRLLSSWRDGVEPSVERKDTENRAKREGASRRLQEESHSGCSRSHAPNLAKMNEALAAWLEPSLTVSPFGPLVP
jgi:hypothetical protein